ncbi:MAG: AAA family ATPase [bacterium]
MTEKDIPRLIEKYESFIKGYNLSNPRYHTNWFSQFIPSQIGITIFEKSIEQYETDIFNKAQNRNYQTGFFKLFINDFLKEQINPFKPVLIPPKRKLEYDITISTDAGPSPSGENLLNRLFFLKNQDPHSKESKIYKEIYNKFSEITNGYYFNVVPIKGNKISLRFTNNPVESGNWINAENSGLGLRDILIIISFIIDFDYNFIMIEEPENHVHPDMQRKLISFITSREDKQFLLATHSNIFLNPTLADKICRTEMDNEIKVSDDTTRANLLLDLGYSVVDNLISDLMVLTEGPKDKDFLEEIFKKMGFWEKYSIKFLPLGGDIMAQIDLSALVDNFDKNKIIALIDLDHKSKSVRDEFKKNCGEKGVECFQLKRYAIENYIPLNIIRNLQGFNVPADITEIKPDKKVEDQIGFNLKKYLRKLAKAMDIKDLENTDLLEFCKKVEVLVKE